MKRVVFAGVTALAVIASSQAFAQAVSIDLAPDQRTKIKEYVVKERVAPVTVKERVTIGATLPAGIELRAVPSDWGPSVSRYRYIYHDNRVVFVEPSSRKSLRFSTRRAARNNENPGVRNGAPGFRLARPREALAIRLHHIRHVRHSSRPAVERSTQPAL